MLQTKFVEKIKTKFIFSNFFFRKSTYYEIMWQNVVQPDRPQMAIKYRACALHAG